MKTAEQRWLSKAKYVENQKEVRRTIRRYKRIFTKVLVVEAEEAGNRDDRYSCDTLQLKIQMAIYNLETAFLFILSIIFYKFSRGIAYETAIIAQYQTQNLPILCERTSRSHQNFT